MLCQDQFITIILPSCSIQIPPFHPGTETTKRCNHLTILPTDIGPLDNVITNIVIFQQPQGFNIQYGMRGEGSKEGVMGSIVQTSNSNLIGSFRWNSSKQWSNVLLTNNIIWCWCWCWCWCWQWLWWCCRGCLARHFCLPIIFTAASAGIGVTYLRLGHGIYHLHTYSLAHSFVAFASLIPTQCMNDDPFIHPNLIEFRDI